MIDVSEGDCYIVDLLNVHDVSLTCPEDVSSTGPEDVSLTGPENAANWIRYLIDTDSSARDRLRRIMFALINRNEIDPWPKPDLIRSGLPLLSGAIITHSDRDHSGNASDVLDQAVQSLWQPSIFFNKTNDPLHQVPVYVSPMVQWTRDLDSKKIFPDLIRIQGFRNLDREIETYKNGEIGVELVDSPLTVDRSFQSLETLCNIGDYALQYRFNLLKPHSDRQFLKTQCVKGALDPKVVPSMFWRSDWQDSNRIHIDSLLAPVRENSMIPLYPLNVLVEVALMPRENAKRTLGSHTRNKKVTGSWLRMVCDLYQDGKVLVEPSRSVSPEDDLPAFRVELINHHVKYNKLLEAGPWSASVMGCADKDFVRDFQHRILQSMVPNVIHFSDLMGEKLANI